VLRERRSRLIAYESLMPDGVVNEGMILEEP